MTGSTETRIDEIFPARDVMWFVSCMEESANTSFISLTHQTITGSNILFVEVFAFICKLDKEFHE